MGARRTLRSVVYSCRVKPDIRSNHNAVYYYQSHIGWCPRCPVPTGRVESRLQRIVRQVTRKRETSIIEEVSGLPLAAPGL